MKKLLLVNVIFVCFIFVSCAINKIVYDESYPQDDSAQIMPSGDIGIDEFNGKSVHWYPGLFSGTEVSIPSGEAEIVFTLLDAKQGNFVWRGGAYILEYNFEKGHNYYIMVKNIISNTEVLLTIDDKTTKKKTNVTTKPKQLGSE